MRPLPRSGVPLQPREVVHDSMVVPRGTARAREHGLDTIDQDAPTKPLSLPRAPAPPTVEIAPEPPEPTPTPLMASAPSPSARHAVRLAGLQLDDATFVLPRADAAEPARGTALMLGLLVGTVLGAITLFFMYIAPNIETPSSAGIYRGERLQATASSRTMRATAPGVAIDSLPRR